MRPTLLFLFGLLCASPGVAADRTVLAVNIGWHVGLAFRSADLDPAALPEAGDFPDARWIEVGWGDEGFYRDPDAGVTAMLRAAFASSGAVLHMVAMPVHPARYLPASEVMEIPLDDGQFAALVAYVSNHLDRGGRRRAEAVGQGLYPVSRFYPARGAFSLDRTCNTWVAQALAAAGLPLDPEGVVRASTLMARLRTVVGAPPAPSAEPSEHR